VAEPLKNRYGLEIPRRIADMIVHVCPSFPKQAFLRDALAGYYALELMPRGRHIARALHAHLPQDVPKALDILLASLDAPGLIPTVLSHRSCSCRIRCTLPIMPSTISKRLCMPSMP